MNLEMVSTAFVEGGNLHLGHMTSSSQHLYVCYVTDQIKFFDILSEILSEVINKTTPIPP
jgi:hypothetical protein